VLLGADARQSAPARFGGRGFALGALVALALRRRRGPSERARRASWFPWTAERPIDIEPSAPALACECLRPDPLA
jgi:hypothetical protein